MNNFYSYLLQSLPKPASPPRTFKKLVLRLSIILFFALLIISAVIIIATRALSVKGPGFILYWIHDHIYLPIKGYTFTRFYPFSIGWWGIIATAFIIFLITYLTMISIIKDPHTYLLRRILRRTSSHSILFHTSTLLKRWKILPQLLLEVTSLERKITLYELSSLPFSPPSEKLLSRLVQQTRLNLRLLLLPPIQQNNQLEALEIWHSAYLILENAGRINPQSSLIKNLLIQLTQDVHPITLSLLKITDNENPQIHSRKESPFDISSIALDLFYLQSLNSESSALFLFQVSSQSQISYPHLKQKVMFRLIHSIYPRQNILYSLFRRLERNQFPLISQEEKFLEYNQMEILYRLSQSIAIHLASLAENEAIALDYLEAGEALAFIAQSLPPDDERLNSIQPLLILPPPYLTRFIDQLITIRSSQEEKAWHDSILS